MGKFPEVAAKAAATVIVVLGATFGAAVTAPQAVANPGWHERCDYWNPCDQGPPPQQFGGNGCYNGCQQNYNQPPWQQYWVAQRAVNWGDGDSFTDNFGRTEWFIRTGDIPDWARLDVWNNTVYYHC